MGYESVKPMEYVGILEILLGSKQAAIDAVAYAKSIGGIKSIMPYSDCIKIKSACGEILLPKLKGMLVEKDR